MDGQHNKKKKKRAVSQVYCFNRRRHETSTVDLKTRDKSRGILNFLHNLLIVLGPHSTNATSGRQHNKHLATEHYTEDREKSEILRRDARSQVLPDM